MLKGSRPATVVRPEIKAGRRVIAISDIHGRLSFLKAVLDKCRFSAEDVLVLVGDLLEKGEESLGVLRYVMELCKEHTVYALSGNCDYIDRVFLEGGKGIDAELWPVFRFWKERSLILQMGEELGIRPQSEADLPRLRRAILKQLPDETGFLLNMPHIMEAGNYIFVHGGVPREDRLDELEAYSCMKNDDFMGQGHSFRKWIVVGHWPVTLYDPAVPKACPLIDRERHIISIDGGCVLKVDGQLNALIIPDLYEEDIEYTAYDGMPVVIAEEDQLPSEAPVNIRWSDSAVEVLCDEDDVCWCRHVSSGRELWILKEYLYPRRSDGYIHCEDSTDYLLPVKKGDRLGLVRSSSKGYLVKKKGITGWYRGSVKQLKDGGDSSDL